MVDVTRNVAISSLTGTCAVGAPLAGPEIPAKAQSLMNGYLDVNPGTASSQETYSGGAVVKAALSVQDD